MQYEVIERHRVDETDSKFQTFIKGYVGIEKYGPHVLEMCESEFSEKDADSYLRQAIDDLQKQIYAMTGIPAEYVKISDSSIVRIRWVREDRFILEYCWEISDAIPKARPSSYEIAEENQIDWFIDLNEFNECIKTTYINSLKDTTIHFNKLAEMIENYTPTKETPPELFHEYSRAALWYGKCDVCNGTGTITCDKCGGTFYYKCESCNGMGKLKCIKCGGSSTVICTNCFGSGTTTCGACSGTGKNNINSNDQLNIDTCPYCNGAGKRICYSCDGARTVSCGCDSAGNAMCDSCQGYGIIACKSCNGIGTLQCPTCLGYGYVHRIGKAYIKCIWKNTILTKNSVDLPFDANLHNESYAKLGIESIPSGFAVLFKAEVPYCEITVAIPDGDTLKYVVHGPVSKKVSEGIKPIIDAYGTETINDIRADVAGLSPWSPYYMVDIGETFRPAAKVPYAVMTAADQKSAMGGVIKDAVHGLSANCALYALTASLVAMMAFVLIGRQVLPAEIYRRFYFGIFIIIVGLSTCLFFLRTVRLIILKISTNSELARVISLRLDLALLKVFLVCIITGCVAGLFFDTFKMLLVKLL
jgi:hypothetical protein